MRKTMLLLVTLAFFVGQSIASPVDVTRAQRLGLKFMQRNAAKHVAALDLAYTGMTETGVAALYVFNANDAFVVVAADDAAHPILGYSEEGAFDADNLPDGLAYYLRHYARQIGYAIENQIEAEPEIAAQWEQVERDGRINPDRSATAVPPLFTLNWNQDCYYNLYCPTSTNWMAPCGRVYVGCVADAMAMIMKFWNWPDHGSGSHSYTPTGYPLQSVDYESTYYDWNNMPASLSSGSPLTQKQAIALLMWHCGVSVNMNYSYDGSGASSYDVPDALKTYFRYNKDVELRSREDYTKTQWEDLLINSFDRGIPCYYSGAEGNAGHAFVCIGYNDNRQFYFNWGWSGQGNGYYTIDALNTFNGSFNDYQKAIFNFVPDYIYDALMPAASNFIVGASNAHTKTGVVTWTNPTNNLGGEVVDNIEKVVLLRNGVEIFSQTNVAPGEVMTYEDEVPDYDCYTYTLYYLSNNVKSEFLHTSFQYGPTCTWKVICQTTNFQGWNGNTLQLLNAFGSVVDEITMTSSTPMSKQIRVPEGGVSFKWVPSLNTVPNLTINIKNSSNTSVYNYSGSSNNLNGVLTTLENDCNGCQPPTGFGGSYQWIEGEFGTLLTWNYDEDPQSFKVYRSVDGVDYEEVATVDKTLREYFDVADAGTYFYKVTAYRSYCESTPAWADDDHDYVCIDVTSVNESNCDGFKLYPNPARSLVCIEAEGLEQIDICNMMGQRVYQQQCSEDGAVVSVSDLPAGVYFLTVKTSQTMTTKRLTVVH